MLKNMGSRDNNKRTGNLGESIACRFLMKHGYEVIERNYWKKCGEIDIIAKKSREIHFIEVKSVSSEIFKNVSDETSGLEETVTAYRPEDNLHPWKLQRIARTIQLYLEERGVSDETVWLFDVVTVYIDKKRLVSRVSMLENIIL